MESLYWTKSNGEIVDHTYLISRAKKLRPDGLIARKESIVAKLNDRGFIQATNGMLVSSVLKDAEIAASRMETLTE